MLLLDLRKIFAKTQGFASTKAVDVPFFANFVARRGEFLRLGDLGVKNIGGNGIEKDIQQAVVIIASMGDF